VARGESRSTNALLDDDVDVVVGRSVGRSVGPTNVRSVGQTMRSVDQSPPSTRWTRWTTTVAATRRLAMTSFAK